MDRLGGLIARKFGKSTLTKQVEAGLNIEAANAAIKRIWGALITREAKAISLKNGILTIYASGPIVAQELKFKQNKLMAEFNLGHKEPAVKKLKIVIHSLESEDKSC